VIWSGWHVNTTSPPKYLCSSCNMVISLKFHSYHDIRWIPIQQLGFTAGRKETSQLPHPQRVSQTWERFVHKSSVIFPFYITSWTCCSGISTIFMLGSMMPTSLYLLSKSSYSRSARNTSIPPMLWTSMVSHHTIMTTWTVIGQVVTRNNI
jgi:hypothetical protein